MKRRLTAVIMLIAVFITSMAPSVSTESFETVPPVVTTPEPVASEMPVVEDENAGISLTSEMDVVADATAEPTEAAAGANEVTEAPAVTVTPVPVVTETASANNTPAATAVPAATEVPADSMEPDATAKPTPEPSSKLNIYFTDCSGHVFANEACIEAKVAISGGTPAYKVTFVIKRYDEVVATLPGTVGDDKTAAIYWMPTSYGTYTVGAYLKDAAGNEVSTNREVDVAERLVESEADWDASVAGIQLTDNWNEDIVAIAASQLGYAESAINYIYNEEGAKKGYTRYGHRFGMHYEEWCAMFVSFCLDYAGIDEYYYPRGFRSREIRAALLQKGGYEDNEDAYIPVSGDLIFFASDEKHTNDYPTHIAIVSDVDEFNVYTIEGNTSDRNVARRQYALDDENIVGYANTAKLMEYAEIDIRGYVCGMINHAHGIACYDEEETLICTDPVHQHSEACLPETEDNEVAGDDTITYYCGQEAHTHDEKCYDENGVFVCQTMEHIHTDECLKAGGNDSSDDEIIEEETVVYNCGKEAHTHSDKCFDENNVFVCQIVEHIHSEECVAGNDEPVVYYCGIEAHIHGETCYDADGNQTCALPEHIHGEECTVVADEEEEETPVYYCGLEAHTHDESCYDAEGNWVCVIPEHIHTEECTVAAEEEETPVYYCGLEEHAHAETCYDAEGNLVCVLPEHAHTEECTVEAEETPVYYCGLEEHTHAETCYDAEGNLVCIIPEHTHTEECIVAAEEEETPVYYCGYKEHKHDEKCYDVENILKCEFVEHLHTIDCLIPVRYCGKDEHEHSIECYDSEGACVCELYEHIHDDNCLIEVFEQTYVGDDYVVNVFYGHNACIPSNAILIAEEILQTDDRYSEFRGEIMDSDDDISRIDYFRAFDIRFEVDGFEVEPYAEVKVNIVLQDVEAETLDVAHFSDNGNMNQPETITENGVNDETVVSFNTDSFSGYVVFLTEENGSTAARSDDISVVGGGQGIKFGLFDYSIYINLKKRPDFDVTSATTAAEITNWRNQAPYFNFRGSNYPWDVANSATITALKKDINTTYDVDGYTANHTTVETHLSSGYPVLDFTKDANGKEKVDPGIAEEDRYLKYLFSAGDPEVSAYFPSNTILQNSGAHYWYDSKLNAVDYDPAANVFRVRSYTERNETTSAYAGYSDFMPFNSSNREPRVVGTNTSTNVEYNIAAAECNYWYGMTMEIDFYQTKDGKIDGKDMIFEFSGDDDVWVFIDDILVLDLGGTHGTVDGSINFSTGEIKQYLSWGGKTENNTTTSFPTTIAQRFAEANATPNGGWNETGTTFANYSKHTLKFFYMERGAAVANCKLDFYLPTIPEGSLTVTKDLETDADASQDVKDFIENSLTYQFRVMKADDDGNATDDLFITQGTTYTLIEADQSTSIQTVGPNGIFELKAGQSARFDNMLLKGGGATNYVVQEIMPDGLVGQYGSIEYEVVGGEGITKTDGQEEEEFTAFETGALTGEKGQVVVFRNKVDTDNLGILKVSKALASGAHIDSNKSFDMQVSLGGELLPVDSEYIVGNATRKVVTPGVITLKIGETATIVDGILSGTEYEIVELGTETGGFNAAYSGTVTYDGTTTDAVYSANGANGEFPLGAIVHVTVTNANYDFSGEIPISKTVIDGKGNVAFAFEAHQGTWVDGVWTDDGEIPGTTITATNADTVNGKIVIGYQAGTSGKYYYRISEKRGMGNYIYDDNFYIVEMTVTSTGTDGKGTATVTGIWKNGTDEITPVNTTLPFENRRTTNITVGKTVVFPDGNVDNANGREFTFIATIMLNDEIFRVDEFSLNNGDFHTITEVPVKAKVIVKETNYDGYLVSYTLGSNAVDQYHNDTATLQLTDSDSDVRKVDFINKGGYELPLTGGTGTAMYTMGGLAFIVVSAILLYNNKHRKGVS